MDASMASHGLNGTKLEELLKQVDEEVRAIQSKQKKDQEETQTLRSELEVLRRAYRSLETEKTDLEQKLEKMDRRNEALQTSERRAMCLIDGDGAIFLKSLVSQGREGGLKAARTLRDSIDVSLSPDTPPIVWIYVFMNKRGLTGPLGVSDVVMDEFISGFNQAEGKTFAIDIGYGKETADARVRELLQESVRSSYVSKIFFGGSHDNGYVPVLDSLITQGFRPKLTLVPGFTEVANGIRRLDLPTLDIPDLFEPYKLVFSTLSNFRPGRGASFSSPRKLHTPLPPSFPPTVRAESETSETSSGSTPSKKSLKYLQPGKPFWANKPPICNMHYLGGGCPFGDKCIHSHEYVLRPGELERIRSECKATVMCNSIKQGKSCPRGDACIYKHTCKFGSKCTHFKKGRCNFGGEDAHKDS